MIKINLLPENFPVKSHKGNRDAGLPDKPCEICGSMFTPYVARARWCSEKCRNKKNVTPDHLKSILPCRHCGKDFGGHASNKVYCSDKCREQHKTFRRNAFDQKHIHECSECKIPFKSKDVRQKYCSTYCRQKGLTAEKKAKPKKHSIEFDKIKRNESSKLLRLTKLYGITQEQYDYLLIAQSYCCAVCQDLLDMGGGTHLDHDHTKPKGPESIRGIICRGCNTGLGAFKDSSTRLNKAEAYIIDYETNGSPLLRSESPCPSATPELQYSSTHQILSLLCS